MKKSKRLVFFGNERLATGLDTTDCPTLTALIKNGYEVAAVVSSYSQARSRSTRPLEIAAVAAAHQIPLLLPEKLGDIRKQLKDYGAEAAVLVAYGRIVPEPIIDIFPMGIINIHPSLLPKYRGSTPVETAILDGAEETGVSLMRLVKEMDAGPVFAQKRYNLSGSETKAELAAALLKLGSEMLIDHLPAILEGWDTPKPQIAAEATYTRMIKKDDGVLDFDRPAEDLERQVRAYAGWPRSRADADGHQIIATKARVAGSVSDGALVMKCQPGFLEIEELIAPSGRKMSGQDFLSGYRR